MTRASDTSAFSHVFDALDDLHRDDPKTVEINGADEPKELIYARRMSAWLAHIHPEATETLRLAVRAQHLQRWLVPRAEYPEGRVGYLTWRRDQSHQAGGTTAALMHKAGYGESDAERTANIIRKQGLGRDDDVQTLEDCACLVFLENYFADFSRTIERDHLIRIVQKTWRKMSPAAHELALTLPMSDASTALVHEALHPR
ncbi:DUF4202 domain-containing protein [Vreelandella subglaciescola]|jgi:hypothetical protein|uniref:DUF4202 domain-containing protein n=1 Tax=Vreelandella subglaciescola TaxID=29571 RepID=A0A1M7IMH5_9GAMM|nr:DUF4202 domain-containing protein [Halomonas subglaciescola]SHM42024.1 protein of unknown function [Halomonas subglaciescola]